MNIRDTAPSFSLREKERVTGMVARKWVLRTTRHLHQKAAKVHAKKRRGGGWDAYEKLIMHRPHLRWDGSMCVERKGPATPLPDKSRLLVHEHQQDQILCM